MECLYLIPINGHPTASFRSPFVVQSDMAGYRLRLPFYMLVLMTFMVKLNGDPTCSPAGNFWCNSGRCCSIYNWCGSTAAYCAQGNCLAQCWSSVAAIDEYDATLLRQNLTAADKINP